MYIPKEYHIDDGATAPEGTTVLKCSICGEAFAVPAEIAEKVSAIQVCDCDACKEAFEKQAAAEAHALMQAPQTEATQKEIDAAKGK